MKVEMSIEKREIRGSNAIEFEIFDMANNSKNIGTLIIGKGGTRWREPRQPNTGAHVKAKSWREAREWLLKHGRTVGPVGRPPRRIP